MYGGIARGRLGEERNSWRKNHPYGFVAKPESLPDGTVNLMVWNCVIPGKSGTDWEGGYYPLTLHFSEDYPVKAPICKFPKNFFQPNVYSSGMICLSIINEYDMLDQPNPDSPAQSEACQLFLKDPVKYKKNVCSQAKQYQSSIV